jgi:competence protein ComEA
MRSRSLAAHHDAAVSRRLELLTTELAAVRAEDPDSESDVPQATTWGPQGATRIRAVPDLEEADEPDEPDHPMRGDGSDERDRTLGRTWGPVLPVGPAPSAVLLPGRHASRRSTTSWSDLVPEGLRGRVVLGPGQVAVVAVLVAMGLALTCWWLVRSGGHEESAPLAVTTPPGGLATPQAPSGSVSPVAGGAPTARAGSAKVVVDVTGKVRRPGIAVLRQGARIVDALRAAGGVRSGVDLAGLNLAQVLTDGEQVVVGAGAPVTGPVASAPTSGSPVAALVDINTADETTLESLPDVGPVTATAIITWRTQHGAFTSVDQLLDVDGIGDATLAKLTAFVTI